MTLTLDASLDASLDDVIDRALSDQRIVGTVVLVARGGDLVYARAAGDAPVRAVGVTAQPMTGAVPVVE